MSTIMARRVAATPVRTAAQTWAKIVDLLAPDPSSPARKELAGAAGVGCAAIGAEATKDAPIVVWGGGPRVRVYNIFDEDAITQEGVNEDALPKSPTARDWRLSIPCEPEDVAWSNAELAKVSTRISARAVDEDVDDGTDEAQAAATPMSINLTEFLKS